MRLFSTAVQTCHKIIYPLIKDTTSKYPTFAQFIADGIAYFQNNNTAKTLFISNNSEQQHSLPSLKPNTQAHIPQRVDHQSPISEIKWNQTPAAQSVTSPSKWNLCHRSDPSRAAPLDRGYPAKRPSGRVSIVPMRGTTRMKKVTYKQLQFEMRNFVCIKCIHVTKTLKLDNKKWQ